MNSFDETALIYAYFGDGPTIFKAINYVVSLYCVWAERPSKAACFRVWQLFHANPALVDSALVDTALVN
jgi:hypothetical protein